MATGNIQSQCTSCNKYIKAAFECKGCSKLFCLKHLTEHNQQLQNELDQIEDQRNEIQQIISEQNINPEKCLLFQEINQWEINSIEIIKKTANEARQALLKHINSAPKQNLSLNQITNEIKHLRETEDFNELNLTDLKLKLNQLESQLHQPVNVILRQDSTLIKKLSLTSRNIKWAQNGITVTGGNQTGSRLNQLDAPLCIEIDSKQTIYIVDQVNNRLVQWKKNAINGELVAGGSSELYYPRNLVIDEKNDCFIISDFEHKRIVRYSRRINSKPETIISDIKCWGLAMDKNGYLYVSDHTRHEVRRWKIGETSGTLVAGGNGKGNGLHQFDEPRYIFVDENESVYVADRNNHRVMKWTKNAREGVVVAGGHNEGSSRKHLCRPNGVFVDNQDTIYIADAGNNRIVRWWKDSSEGEVIIDGNGRDQYANQLSNPIDLVFDSENNLYVLDRDDARVQKFNRIEI